MNSASVLLSRQKFSQAAQIYDKALEFLSKKNSFFINEFNMACKWLGNYPGALQYAQKLLDEYQKSPADALITWDPLLLEEISKGIIGKEPVRLLLSSSTDTPSDQKKLYQALAKQQSQYPGSKWIKSQMAIVAWKLGQEAKAFFLWPFGASSHPPFLWMGAQLSLQVGQLDTAMLCMAELKEVLPAQDTAAMTPFTRVYIELCQEAVLKKN
jgi:tetratricopeptide (TPR) repeat protein